MTSGLWDRHQVLGHIARSVVIGEIAKMSQYSPCYDIRCVFVSQWNHVKASLVLRKQTVFCSVGMSSCAG